MVIVEGNLHVGDFLENLMVIVVGNLLSLNRRRGCLYFTKR